MRVDNNGRPSLRKPGSPKGPRVKTGHTNRMGQGIRVVPKDFIDPIEYAQRELRREYAARMAQIMRQKEAS